MSGVTRQAWGKPFSAEPCGPATAVFSVRSILHDYAVLDDDVHRTKLQNPGGPAIFLQFRLPQIVTTRDSAGGPFDPVSPTSAPRLFASSHCVPTNSTPAKHESAKNGCLPNVRVSQPTLRGMVNCIGRRFAPRFDSLRMKAATYHGSSRHICCIAVTGHGELTCPKTPFSDVLLSVWREACRHIEIQASTASIAALLAEQLPMAACLSPFGTCSTRGSTQSP